MRLAILAGVTLAFTTAAALADQFEGMYGNTVHQKDAKGRTSVIYVNRDGTWEQRTPDGKVMRGTFRWKDDTHFCIVVTEPAPKPGEQARENCDNEITGNHKVGDTWTMTDEDGTTTLSITAGRQ
jgi:hypothetical protein